MRKFRVSAIVVKTLRTDAVLLEVFHEPTSVQELIVEFCADNLFDD